MFKMNLQENHKKSGPSNMVMVCSIYETKIPQETTTNI